MKISTNKKKIKNSSGEVYVSTEISESLVDFIEQNESQKEIETESYSVVSVVYTQSDQTTDSIQSILPDGGSAEISQDTAFSSFLIPQESDTSVQEVSSSLVISEEEGIEEIIFDEETEDSTISTPETENATTRKFANSQEKIIGESLSSNEKPKILASIAKNVKSGFPESQVLFIKKPTTGRVIVKNYSIYRKNLFMANDFEKIAEITPEETSANLSEENLKYLQTLGLSSANVFIFEDRNILQDSIYVYRVGINWKENLEIEEDESSESAFPETFIFFYTGSVII